MPAVTGWWEELYARFTLSLTPDLGMDARGPAQAGFALALTPDLAMEAVGIGGYFPRAFELALTPDLGMDAIGRGGVSSAAFELSLTPDLGMASGASLTASFDLALSPDLDMAAGGRSVAAFELALTPDLDMSATGRSLSEVVLALTPDFEVAAVGIGGASTAAFELSLTPDLGMSATGVGGYFTRSFELSLTPDLEMVGVGADPFTPTLVSVTTTGAYSVPWPAGATKVDRVLIGGGGGAAGANASAVNFPGSPGSDSFCSTGTELRSTGGAGGYSSGPNGQQKAVAPGDKTYNGQTYVGGTVSATLPSNGGAPGAGGNAPSIFGIGAGISAVWATDTLDYSAGSPPAAITGSVGTGGAGYNGGYAPRRGGDGGIGAAHFYFHK
jgi:hypothetical protein